jgi:hypothetical protein
MRLSRPHFDCNYSAGLTPLGRPALTSALWSSWSTQKFSQLVAYEDSVLANTGCLTYPFPVGFDSLEQHHRFWQHFGATPETLSTGNVAYRDTFCHSALNGFGKQGELRTASSRFALSENSIGKFVKVVRTTSFADAKELQLELHSESDIVRAVVAVVSLEGRRLGKPWSGDIKKGASLVRLKLPVSASGRYIVYLLDSGGSIIGSTNLPFLK